MCIQMFEKLTVPLAPPNRLLHLSGVDFINYHSLLIVYLNLQAPLVLFRGKFNGGVGGGGWGGTRFQNWILKSVLQDLCSTGKKKKL